MMRKVRSFIQNHDFENGAICLAMICDYFGYRISSDDACMLCDVTVNGCTINGICHGAESIGLDATEEKIEVSELNKTKLPCIAVLKNEKYIVIDGLKDDTIFFCDPVEGHSRCSIDDFKKIYNGSVITFRKNKQFRIKFNRSPVLQLVGMILKDHKLRFSVYVILSLLAALITIAEPSVLKKFTDMLFSQNYYSQLNILTAYLLMCILSIVLSYVSSAFAVDVRKRITAKNEGDFTLATLNLSNGFYERNGEGDLVIRKREDTMIVESLIDIAVNYIINLVMLVACAVYIICQSSFIAVFVVVLNVLAYLFLFIHTRRQEVIYKKLQYYLTEVAHFIYTSTPMIEMIKSAGTEYTFFKKHADLLSEATEVESEYIKKDICGNIIPSIIFSLMQVVILIVGYIEILYGGNITYGGILSAYAVYNLMKEPIQYVLNNTTGIRMMNNQADRSIAVLNQLKNGKDENKEAMEKTEGILDGKIEVEDVSYAFSRYGEPFIRNLSFTIQKGEHVAIVGKSGSGKTTIKNLLLGRYKPKSGKIYFDGIDSEKISPEVIADSIGAVDQQILMFEGSVLENVTMWDTTMEDYQIALAMRDAQIYDTVIERKAGMSEQLWRNGSNFSGGERQRLEISRALAREPRILILDEATSALDARTEKLLTDRIKERSITTITIAHRLSTIRDSDRIFVIENGKIVAQGTHDELMRSCEIYNDLVITE